MTLNFMPLVQHRSIFFLGNVTETKTRFIAEGLKTQAALLTSARKLDPDQIKCS